MGRSASVSAPPSTRWLSIPRPPGAKALTGMTSVLRIRVGDYRILYEVQDDRLMVLVIDVGHRREIYR
jgi:mRNA interferase RelE/StbE